MKTIVIANQKGGTAKTTSTAALGVQLSRQGIPTHLIDMDPQADLTAAFGLRDPENKLFVSLDKQTPLPVVNVTETLTISPSSLQLLRAETEFLSRPSREFVLKASLQQTKLPKNVVVLTDCPLSLGVLSVASLVAADGICFVVQPGGFELQTLVHLGQTADLLKEYANPNLASIGAIVTNSHSRRAITAQVAQELASRYDVLGIVRADAKIVYATTAGRIHRLRRSAAMEDYDSIATRIKKWVTS